MEMLQGYPLRITFFVAPAILVTNWWYRHFLCQINVGRCPTLGLTMKLCFARSTLAANTCRLLQDYEKAMAKMAKKAAHVMSSSGCLMLRFSSSCFSPSICSKWCFSFYHGKITINLPFLGEYFLYFSKYLSLSQSQCPSILVQRPPKGIRNSQRNTPPMGGRQSLTVHPFCFVFTLALLQSLENASKKTGRASRWLM